MRKICEDNGHRATDVSDSLFFKHPNHLLPEIQLGEIKSRLKRQIIKWKLI